MPSSRFRVPVFLAVILLFSICGFNPSASADDVEGASAVQSLAGWLDQHPLNGKHLKSIAEQTFAATALSKADAEKTEELLWNARLIALKESRKAEFDAGKLPIGNLEMPFWYKVFGDRPESGRSLFISMHGGGGAPAAVNDQQYENQKRLYQLEEGVYLVPRAATNTWDLWHQSHIDDFFDRLIADMILFEGVNPDRVFIMGYSAGGDGVYQLTPRMADRLAAASMMAGHPNEALPDGLRNIGFTIHMGANDAAYNRNQKAEEWRDKLVALKENDKDGYVHEVTLHPGRGHWMNLKDAVAIPWMARFTRNVWPPKVVWAQDDVIHSRFYWISTQASEAKAGDKIIATLKGNTIVFDHSDAKQVTLLLSDRLLNLDEVITVESPTHKSSEHKATRTIMAQATSLSDRFDRPSMYSATIDVSLSE